MNALEIHCHPKTICLQELFIDGEKRFGVHPSTLNTLINTYNNVLPYDDIDVDDIENKIIELFEKEGYSIFTQLEGEEVQNSGIEFEFSFVYQMDFGNNNFARILAIEKDVVTHPLVKSTASF